MAESGKPKLIFASSVEAMLKAAEGNVRPETEKRLAELRLFMRKPVDPAYPAESWAEAVRLISADMFPQEQPEDQHRKLGRAAVQRFADTFMGRAMFSAAKVLGVKRSLHRMTNNFRTGANFIETTFTALDEKNYELWLNDCNEVPGFYAGLLEVGADHISGWPDQIRVKLRDGTACLYTLSCTR